jgi:hypothetical protein
VAFQPSWWLSSRQIGKCGGREATVDADISEALPNRTTYALKENRRATLTVPRITLHTLGRLSVLSQKDQLSVAHAPKTPPRTPCPISGRHGGRNGNGVGELQGDGFGRGGDCIPTETCCALHLLTFRETWTEPKEEVRSGHLRQSDLILCLLLNA